MMYMPQKPVSNISTMEQQLRTARQSMWPSEKTASFLYDWANLSLIIALVLGAASTVLVVWMGNVKEEYLNIQLAATSERAANAEQSAAEANKIAEQERLARIKIEQKLAPRSLTQAEIGGISLLIHPFGATPVDIFVADPAPEAGSVALSIGAALTGGGWVPLSWTWTGMGAISGVVVAYEAGAPQQTIAAATSLSAALVAAGIAGSVGVWPGQWSQFAGMLNGPTFAPTRAQIRVIVGSKP